MQTHAKDRSTVPKEPDRARSRPAAGAGPPPTDGDASGVEGCPDSAQVFALVYQLATQFPQFRGTVRAALRSAEQDRPTAGGVAHG
jgi:hypothetical protein